MVMLNFFKEYLKALDKSKDDYERGFIIFAVNNYRLTDLEKYQKLF
jgi:hypothetical protein